MWGIFPTQFYMEFDPDYSKRSGIYYKPFGRKEPVVIRNPDAMQELSESHALSQRAVYADVRSTILA